jgi:hypothetical protein
MPNEQHPADSASDYNPAQCLRAEVERFKATNRFTPMDVTGFYLQAAVVLAEHRRMVEALKEIRDTNWNSAKCGKIAARALPMSETPMSQSSVLINTLPPT